VVVGAVGLWLAERGNGARLSEVGDSVIKIGVDIGGTFTDVVAIESGSGATATAKILTSASEASDPSRAVVEGVLSVLRDFGVSAQGTDSVVHATTLVTNAIIERKGARTGLLVTKGFRDILEMGREIRYDLYDLFLDKPDPLVRRSLRREIEERVLPDGSVRTRVNLDQVRGEVRLLKAAGVESVAVSLLHSYANPDHERAIESLLAEEFPELDLSLSSRIAPVIREYERTSTVVVNGYVRPLVRRYLTRLANELRSLGIPAELRVMLSNGGITSAGVAAEMPVQMIESGPAAGAIAASSFARDLASPKLISFDMGGTTAKICLIDNGEPSTTNFFEAARLHRFKRGSGVALRVPTVQLIEIGAGGGSIAHVDHLGLLKVGPESAGANPGPACYELGGTLPTVTDADVILGFVNPDSFLGGKMPLSLRNAEQVITELGRVLGLSTIEAAIGVYEVVTNNMAIALRLHAAERGRDYRDYDLFAFGGAGPVHAYGLARSLGMRRLICPLGAGILSAFGLLAAPTMMQLARSAMQDLSVLDVGRIEGLYKEMADEGLSRLRGAQAHPDTVEQIRSVEMRYVGQGYELEVVMPNGSAPDEPTLAALFRAAYKERYNLVLEDVPVEALTWRLTLKTRAPDVRLTRRLVAGTPRPFAKRRVYLPDERAFARCDVYDRNSLPVGFELRGPALIEEADSALLVGAGAIAAVDSLQNLSMTLSS